MTINYEVISFKIITLIILIIFIKISNIIGVKKIRKKNYYIKYIKQKEIKDYNTFLNYTEMPKDPNDPLIIKERKDILENFSNKINGNLNSGLTIFYNFKYKFGNELLAINKLIFYCEIIRCQKIILDKKKNAFIDNTIYDKKYNITIEVVEYKTSPYYSDLNIYDIIILDPFFYYTNYNLKIENRFSIFKNEILNNLPKIETYINDLYIHFRGGDIFKHIDNKYAPDYAQPPLCFYQKIIETNKFRNIYIISQDRKNIVINKLMKINKNIIYNKNKSRQKIIRLKQDIAYLTYAYNIVGSISSFLMCIIKLNDNLKFFWEYDRYPAELRISHLHHSLYNFKRNYTIFKMEPSDIYKNEMIIWQNIHEQKIIMLNDICPNNFTIINPNI